MFKNLRRKFVRLIASDYITELKEQGVHSELEFTTAVNTRVAQVLSQMDILDILLKNFHGTFSQEYARPEDKLNSQGQLSMKMWGYTQYQDPNFEYLTNWIMDQHANEMLRHAAVTPERILYGRAQIASTELFKREVKRLYMEYADMLEKNKPVKFDANAPVGG